MFRINLDFYNHLRLRSKIVLTFLLFGFFPLVLVSFFQINAVIQVLRRQTEESAATSLDETVRRLDEVFDTYNRIADTFVHDLHMIRMLHRSYPRLSEAVGLYHYILNRANSIIIANPYVQHITIYIVNDDLVSFTPYLIRINSMDDFENPERFHGSFAIPYIGGLRSVDRHNDYWLNPSEDGIPIFSLNRILFPSSVYRRPSGLLTMGISQSALCMLIDTSIGYSVNFIVDHEGMIVTASDPYLSGMSLYSLIEPEKWEAAVTGAYITSARDGYRLLVRELRYGWSLATLISMRELEANTRRIQYMGFAAVALCAGISVLLVSLINNITARRFDTLLKKMRLSSRQIPEPGPPIEGSDEISLLDESFREMTVNLNTVIRELYQVETEKHEAQLLALQSKINPHFLYNTLSAIGWMTQTHSAAQVREAIETLAGYYRTVLSAGHDNITLAEELKGLRAYLAIMHMRGGGRARAVITIDSALDDIVLPKMTLQPIVENCIEHGINPENGCAAIYITSEIMENDVIIRVRNDGPGIDEDMLARIRKGELRSHSGGYGIYNVQMRLKMCFGEGYGLHIENLPKRGVLVSIRIPLSYSPPLLSNP